MHTYRVKRFVLATITGIIASFLFVAAAQANDAIIASGVGSSRSLAIKDAMRNAIEKKIGVIIDARTIVRNARVIEDQIYTFAEGFIRTYDVLAQGEMDGQYTVKIRAVVDENLQSQLMTKLQKKIIVQTGMNDPRIGVAVKVQDTCALSDEAVGNMLIKTLQDNGFSRIIDMKQIGEVQKNQMLYMSMSGQDREALAIMTQFGVDYMVVGGVRTTKGSDVLDGMFRSVKAAVDVRVYNVNTAQIGFADTIIGTGMAVDQGTAELRAVDEAAGSIGERLGEALLKTAGVPQQDIQILVSSERGVDFISNLLENVEGIERIFFRSSRGNFMIFDAGFTGDTMSLLQVLKERGFRIVDAATNRVQVRY